MFLTPIAIAIASPPPPSDMPTQACFEIFADSQGEMARASNPVWRRKARVEIEKGRTENNRRQSQIDKELAETAKRRDRVQRAYDQNVINRDKFATLCSEIEAEMQQLILARDTLQIPPCGFYLTIRAEQPAKMGKQWRPGRWSAFYGHSDIAVGILATQEKDHGRT